MDEEELQFVVTLQEELLLTLREELDTLENEVLQHEQSPTDSHLLKSRRMVHSWKGSAFAANLPDLGKYLHSMEDRFEADDLSTHEKLSFIDFLRNWVDRYQVTGETSIDETAV